MIIKKIAIIGATGRLAPLVVDALVQKGYAVKMVVRNIEKASAIYNNTIEVAKADLTNKEEIKNVITDCNAVYLNLSTELPDAPFQPEWQGVENIVWACKQTGIEHIFKISGLGAYRKDFANGKTIFVNEIRIKGHELIKQSGIPYTFFHPSWFMESLELMFKKGNKLNAFKPIHYPLHWIAGKDYAQMVVKAIELDETKNYDYVMQGPEAITMHDALVRFSKTYEPNLKLSETPIGLIQFLGLFNQKLKIIGMMGEYFKNFKEKLIAQPTWERLGKPTLTIETFK